MRRPVEKLLTSYRVDDILCMLGKSSDSNTEKTEEVYH